MVRSTLTMLWDAVAETPTTSGRSAATRRSIPAESRSSTTPSSTWTSWDVWLFNQADKLITARGGKRYAYLSLNTDGTPAHTWWVFGGWMSSTRTSVSSLRQSERGSCP